ncbi:MAG TPA: hypothetical protein VNO81_05805 [Candidatus Nitrosotenuis sp.]|jgi:hypothetical protein|nr:hypothetical protein [Candidatus Nitrosotenuis sp.]
MAYYVSIKDDSPEAILHWDRCPLRHREDGSRWYGPFTTQEEGREHARGTGKALREDCKCLDTLQDYEENEW